MVATLTETETAVIEALNQATSGITDPEQWLIDALGGGSNTSAGVAVNSQTVLGLPSAWWAINQIAGDVGKLPLDVKQRLPGGGSEKRDDHYAAKILRSPNFFQTGSKFRETMMVHALLHGNGRAWINRSISGQPAELIIIPPGACMTFLYDGVKYHSFTLNSVEYGDVRREETTYWVPDADVFHVLGLSYNGIFGESLLRIARDVFGIDKAGQDTTAHSFRNNGRPGLLLEAPPQAFRSEKDANEFLENFNERHEGVDKTGRTGLIREGMKAHVLPNNARDSQHEELRQFSRTDIALLFGCQMLLRESAVYKDLAERSAAYVTHCLGKWFQAWEDEAHEKLLVGNESQRNRIVFKFNAAELLRGDINNLATYTSSLRQQGIMSGDEARELHGLNPVGLDDYTNPNIQSDAGSGEDQSDDEDESDDELETAQNVIRQQVRHILASEKRRVRQSLQNKTPAEFLASVERHFSNHDTLAGLLVGLGKTNGEAQRHAERALVDLRSLVATAAPETLSELLESLLSTWDERAEELVK